LVAEGGKYKIGEQSKDIGERGIVKVIIRVEDKFASLSE